VERASWCHPRTLSPSREVSSDGSDQTGLWLMRASSVIMLEGLQAPRESSSGYFFGGFNAHAFVANKKAVNFPLCLSFPPQSRLKLFIAALTYADDLERRFLYDSQVALQHNCSLAHSAGAD
jgi:hypothetical protein